MTYRAVSKRHVQMDWDSLEIISDFFVTWRELYTDQDPWMSKLYSIWLNNTNVTSMRDE